MKESMRKTVSVRLLLLGKKWQQVERSLLCRVFLYTLGHFRINKILLGYFRDSICFKKAQKILLGEAQVRAK